ncbi:MAG: RNA pyrophosphohydrolase [Alphaproteobacteria bacterium]|nr:RNA pyrophosphohydrolase [Alphaproteobacteria bacterium]
MADAYSNLPYRPNVGITLFNRQGLVWVGERHSLPGAWQMPQGGIDEDEDPWDAAQRELAEETGATAIERLGEVEDWLTYDLPAHLLGVALGGKYRGQRQKWFACRYLGRDSEFRIDGPEPEFSRWRWMEIEDLPKHGASFKRAVYETLVAEFSVFARPVDE